MRSYKSWAWASVISTSSVGYLRLHGRNTAAWFAEDGDAAERYNYRYSAEELDALIEVAEVIRRLARDTYLITNNHFRGQAALNALELHYHLRRAPVPVPPPLLTAYPELGPIAAPVPEGDA
jgi:uncharacterized protein YecE (DUF72 family)